MASNPKKDPERDLVHADNNDGYAVLRPSVPSGARTHRWTEDPSGNQFYTSKEKFSSEIHPNYINVECGACGHDFWTWAHMETPHCPKCQFPYRSI
jgi:hypothetical protein